MRLVILSLCVLTLTITTSTVSAASYTAQSVADDGRIIVLFNRIPVSLTLAHITLPDDQQLHKQAIAQIEQLIKGKRIRVDFRNTFGVDRLGAGRVHMTIDKTNIARELVEAGLARYQAASQTENAYEKPLISLEEKAKKKEKGIWAANKRVSTHNEHTTPAATTKPKKKKSTKRTAQKTITGPYCAELNSKFYYPSDASAVRHAKNLIYYKNEREAKRAGKKPAPKNTGDVQLSSATEQQADEYLKKGTIDYVKAVNLPPTHERDKLYGACMPNLMKAAQIYSHLIENGKGNDDMQEKLRKAMMYRYGAMKSKRHH